MCGIVGVYCKSVISENDLRKNLVDMNNTIIHRGPDDDGMFIEKEKPYSLGMGMRRLAIIDLHTGTQPICNDDKSIIIVFNGEIYNYKHLKNKLKKEGIVFKTTSDTEVILRLYEKYGTISFEMLDGMFAFSIYDKNLDKVFIARDFFGEKPLYYYKASDTLYWASELKSIVNMLPATPDISKKALSLYFQLTYIPAPFTIYEDIFKLNANHLIELDCKIFELKTTEIRRKKTVEYGNLSFEKAKNITHELVQKSVQLRAVSDVPIGTFLSGGVDSSIVSLCLSQQTEKTINTFSMGFEKKTFDETDKSKIVAKLIGSKHHEFRITEKDLAKDLDSVLLNFDEPFADSSALPTYLVSKITENHVKVALTGDGGDEVFGGYNKYYMGKLNRNYTNIVPKKMHKLITNLSKKIFQTKDDDRGLRFKINRLIESINYNDNFYYNIISLGFQKEELEHLMSPSYLHKDSLDYYKTHTVSSLKDFRNLDKEISLEGDLLVKVDRSSMFTSLECRAPFLNKELWDFTNQLPDSYLIKGWDKKYLLKEAFKQYFPKGFLDKSKKGFGVPVGDWLRSSLKEELLGYIDIYLLEKQKIFNAVYVKNLVLDHIEGRVDNTFRVWTFYCFQKWYFNVYLTK